MTPRTIEIQEIVQGHNERIAAENRALFHAAGLFVINVMSAPGSGKTEFLARTLKDAGRWSADGFGAGSPGIFPDDWQPVSERDRLTMAVIVGDLETDNDARRLNLTGAEVIQITTGGYCHLDAGMVAEAAREMDLTGADILIIENVGNMVCPATFDLGEDSRIALLSVTEGEDKPLKYPTLFKRADAVVINKIDIAEVVGFQRQVALDNIKRLNPDALIFEVSGRTGEGMQDWYRYLQAHCRKEQPQLSHV